MKTPSHNLEWRTQTFGYLQNLNIRFNCVLKSTKLFDLHNFKSYIYAQKFIKQFNI